MHAAVVRLFQEILDQHAAGIGRRVGVYRDIAVRISEAAPRIGFNPDICAAAGIEELIVANPLAAEGVGQREPISIWQRHGGVFECVHAGTGGVRSQVLGGFVIQTTDGLFRIADDPEGVELWPTAAEAARQEAERAKQDAESAKQDAESAKQDAESARQAERDTLRRVAELEAALRRRRD